MPQQLLLLQLFQVVTRPRSDVTTIKRQSCQCQKCCCNSSQIGRHHNHSQKGKLVFCCCNSSQIGRHHNVKLQDFFELCSSCNSSQIGRHHNKRRFGSQLRFFCCNSSQIGRHHNIHNVRSIHSALVVTRPRSDVTTIALMILVIKALCCNSSQIGRHHN